MVKNPMLVNYLFSSNTCVQYACMYAWICFGFNTITAGTGNTCNAGNGVASNNCNDMAASNIAFSLVAYMPAFSAALRQ